MAAIISADIFDFSQYLKETDNKQHVKEAKSYTQQLKDKLRLKIKQKVNYLPWLKSKDLFEFREGELTMWAGVNGHGKSLLTSQAMLSLMGQGEKVCIASFEMRPVVTLQRMARNWIGVNPFTPEFQGNEGLEALDSLYEQFSAWTDGKLWLYDQTGTAAFDTVLGMARYCAKELGINHIVIDNLAKCVAGEDDMNGQKKFIDELTAIARDYKCHIHVVHHIRKLETEFKKPGKNDLKGSGAIGDLADNVFIVFRNKEKEIDLRNGGKFSSMADDPDQSLICVKQRNYEGIVSDEFELKLWFNIDSQLYTGEPHGAPLKFWEKWPH